jgi:hypothetical protein
MSRDRISSTRDRRISLQGERLSIIHVDHDGRMSLIINTWHCVFLHRRRKHRRLDIAVLRAPQHIVGNSNHTDGVVSRGSPRLLNLECDLLVLAGDDFNRGIVVVTARLVAVGHRPKGQILAVFTTGRCRTRSCRRRGTGRSTGFGRRTVSRTSAGFGRRTVSRTSAGSCRRNGTGLVSGTGTRRLAASDRRGTTGARARTSRGGIRRTSCRRRAGLLTGGFRVRRRRSGSTLVNRGPSRTTRGIRSRALGGTGTGFRSRTSRRTGTGL